MTHVEELMMLHFLAGVAIAAVAVIGWFYGNLFVCVFLTIVALLLAWFGIILPIPCAIIAIAWLPRYIRFLVRDPATHS